MPATDTIDFEREFGDLVAELRALPTAAPAPVRERVRAFGEPAQPVTLWDRVRGIAWRRSLLVLAPACVVGVLAASVIHGVANSGPQREAALTARGEGGALESKQPPVLGAAGDRRGSIAPLPGPNPGRYQDYEAWMRVRVQDLDALSDQTNEAMRIVRSYGGYVATVEESSAGGSGQADLVLRVPRRACRGCACPADAARDCRRAAHVHP